MTDEWPFIGRSEDLRRLSEAVAAGAAGVALVGEAGIGKTRLALELAHVLSEDGRVTTVLGTESEEDLPFGAVAHLLPTTLPAVLAVEDLIVAVSRAIAAAADGARVVLVVDDAHLLDDRSAAVVHHLAMRPNVRTVLSVRSDEPLPGAIAALVKDRLLRHDMHGLSRVSSDQLIGAVLEGLVDRSTFQQLWHLSGGNVLMLRETMLGGIDEGVLERRHGFWRWSGSAGGVRRVRELIGARIGALSAEERKVAELLGLTSSVEAGVLESLADPKAVDSLERRGLIRATQHDHRLMLELSHPLYVEHLRAAISPRRRRELSGRLADAIERFGPRRRYDWDRIAEFRFTAGRLDRPELFLDAGRSALGRFDFPAPSNSAESRPTTPISHGRAIWSWPPRWRNSTALAKRKTS